MAGRRAPVIALGGIPNKTQVGDIGIDGRIFPVSAAPAKRGAATGELDFKDDWYSIQVKQEDGVGQPDIDAFEAVMPREDRTRGFFVAFDVVLRGSTGAGESKPAPARRSWMTR